MAVVIFGSPSSSAFGADDVYLSVQAPQPTFPGGGSTSLGLAVGGAGWGPKNTPITCNTPQDLVSNFGPPIGSGFDVVQEGALFLKQNPRGGFIGIRVAHAGDAASTGTLTDTAPAAGLNLTALYTGSFGNTLQVSLVQGTKWQAGTPVWKIIVRAGASFAPEVFDNIGGTANAFWLAAAAAVNNGQGPNRPASQFITAAATASVLQPVALGQTITMTGGLDGATGITSSDQLGVDTVPRTGMYAGRGTGADCVWLCGNSDSTTWSTIATFAQSELALGFGTVPTGTTIAASITAKLTAGIDTPFFVLCKDYVTYVDTYLNTNVAVPPMAVIAGVCCRMNSFESPTNQPVNAIIGTEQSLGSNPKPYANADLATLELAGICLTANPIPAGKTFGVRNGKNSSSNFATAEIGYTRKLNDILRALSLGSVLGQFVGQTQSTAPGDPLRQAMCAAIDGYFGPQKNGTPKQINDYSRVCDLTNNTPTTIAQGILRCDVAVQFLPFANKVLINITAGQTVQINVQSTNAAGQPLGQ